MDIHFLEPEDVPRPKEEVRIQGLEAHPYPDGRRVRVDIRVTPFQERPNLDIEVFNAQGDEVASLNVIESMDHRFEITVHVRGPQPRGKHTARLVLFYPETEIRDQAEAEFDIVPSS